MITTGIRSDQRGQALVEFALVLPIVLLLLFGILQVALVLEARQTVAYAARVAADTYARTLDPASADAAATEAGAQLRPQLRAPVASVSYAITQEETQTCVRTQRRSFGRSRCVQYAPSLTTTDRTATLGAPGKTGDLVIARVTYRYPSPVRAAFGPFRFPADFTMSEEGVARIETTAQPRTSTSASTPVPAPTPIALNFDSASAGGSAGPYLAGFGITITGVSGEGTPTVIIQAAPSWLSTSSPPNALVGPGGARPTGYTLVLRSAVTSVSFSRGGPSSPTSVAAWTATALNASGQTVASVGEPFRCCTFPAQSFTLTGTGITSLRIESRGCSCGIQSPWIDDLTFSGGAARAGVLANDSDVDSVSLPAFVDSYG